MALKVILSDQEYLSLLKKIVKTSFKAHDYFDKYINVLPLEIFEKQYKRLQEVHKKYLKMLEHSTSSNFKN